MKRGLLTLALALSALVWAASAPAATKTYSTGPIRQAIADGGAGAARIHVPDAGPVSYLGVAVRIEHPDDGQLTLELVSPSGKTVVLSRKHGAGGGGYGMGTGCDGELTQFEDGRYNPPIARGKPPFVDEFGPFQPDGRLGSLDGTEAKGDWSLRVVDDATGGAGAIRCFQLTVARAVVQHAAATRGPVTAQLDYKESNGSYSGIRLTITRDGRTALSASLGQVNCARCPSSGPSILFAPRDALKVRDLDGDGEPEVLFDLYTGGAHCCFYTLIFRYRSAERDYRRLTAFWGNPGYRLEDLDGDGRPELVTGDDRFNYAFSAYAYSIAPLLVWHYDHGRLVDVTGDFQKHIANEAAGLWHDYLTNRGGSNDVRGILAAYMADEYRLGRQDEGWGHLERALTRGDLHPYGRKDTTWPTDAAYLRKLRSFLQKTGYVT
jgi:subtilisin-like proprotein convertase family protein